MKFSPRQREVLKLRLAKAIIWYRATQMERDNARQFAASLVSQIEEDNTQRNALDRAVRVIEGNLEVSA